MDQEDDPVLTSSLLELQAGALGVGDGDESGLLSGEESEDLMMRGTGDDSCKKFQDVLCASLKVEAVSYML